MKTFRNITFLLLLICSTRAQAETLARYCLYKSPPQKITSTYASDRDLETATDRDGWTWHSLSNSSNFSKSEYVTSPDKKQIMLLPELYNKPCSYWGLFIGACPAARAVFSSATKMAFINGYKANLLGWPSQMTYAVSGGKAVEIPAYTPYGTTYRGDALSTGSAALRGFNEMLILFDGKDVISLEIPDIAGQKSGKYPKWWIMNDRQTGRSFVQHTHFKGNSAFMYELTASASLKKIPLDANIKGWTILASAPGTRQLWLVDRNGIYAEGENGFHSTFQVAEGSHIHGPAGLGYTNDGKIYIAIADSVRNVQGYTLEPEKAGVDCAIKLPSIHSQTTERQ